MCGSLHGLDTFWAQRLSWINKETTTTTILISNPLSTTRPNQSLYVPFQVNRFHKSILIIVEYKYLKSCREDFILQNLILRTFHAVLILSSNVSWGFQFHQINYDDFQKTTSLDETLLGMMIGVKAFNLIWNVWWHQLSYFADLRLYILISNPLKDKSHLECFLIENIRIWSCVF